MATSKGKARRTSAPAADPTPAGRVVAIAGQKGGTGKSTIACCLAAEAIERGLRVLLVDADPQATTHTWGITRAAEMSGEVLLSVQAMGADMHEPSNLPRLARGFDLVIVDCPGRADDVQRSALAVAELVVFPCGPSAVEMWALVPSVVTFREAQRVRPALDGVIVVTRKQPRTVRGAEARELLAGTGLPVLQTELGYRLAYQDATAAGSAVSRYAPRSEAAREAKALLDDVLARLEVDVPRTGRRARRGQG